MDSVPSVVDSVHAQGDIVRALWTSLPALLECHVCLSVLTNTVDVDIAGRCLVLTSRVVTRFYLY